MHGLLTSNGGTTSSLSCPLDLNLSYSEYFAVTYCDTFTSFSAKVFRSILTTVVASSATRKIRERWRLQEGRDDGHGDSHLDIVPPLSQRSVTDRRTELGKSETMRS